MNPGLVVKLRPTGPWRIGPDSGARNRVDSIYHSDTLYAAVTGALGRLGPLDEWLDATARSAAPAVCFSSCFPFLDEIGFIVPPRTAWPPTSPALLSARVRWKSARFVPLGIMPAILAGRVLDDSQWSVDAASECLVPAGRHGPFRTGMRTNAAVDRLSGSAERHSTACIEFRPGAGLWTVVSFTDDAAAARWLEPVKTAFRLLADSGFGGERSRGWGRSEMPEFIEGVLPDMILPAAAAAPEPPVEEPPVPETPREEPPSPEPAREEPPPVEEPSPEDPPVHEAKAEVAAPVAIVPLTVESAEAELARIAEPPIGEETPAEAPAEQAAPAESGTAVAPSSPEPHSEPSTEDPVQEAEAEVAAPVAIVPLTVEPAKAELARIAEPPIAEETPAEAPAEQVAPAESDTAVVPSSLEPHSEPSTEDPVQEAEAEVAAPVATVPLTVEPAKSELTPIAEEISAEAPAEQAAPAEAASVSDVTPPAPEPHLPPPDPEPQPEPAPPIPEPEPQPDEPAPLPEPSPEPPAPAPPIPAPEPEPLHEPGPPIPEPLPAAPPPTPAGATHPHWLLSLFTPGTADSVDWSRGSYAVVARGGRIESPVRSGERKKQLSMIAEGSVLYTATPPAGAAPDVAPDGFVHPVYRAGFALAIPLPEAS